jgi:hypothetical protein
MIYAFAVFLVVCFLSRAVYAALPVGGVYKSYSIEIPFLTKQALYLNYSEIEKLFALFANKRVIWVVGEFKVGKTFFIDILTQNRNPKADALANTIGLHAWMNSKYVIIDTEGLNQPVTENNPYFIKEFILTFMRLTADQIVIVGDQAKLTDTELYTRLAREYYVSKIDKMFYVHNTKSLEFKQLPEYKNRSMKTFSLNDNFVDDARSTKPVIHKFFPKMVHPVPTNDTLSFLINAAGGLANFMGNLFGVEAEEQQIDSLDDLLENRDTKRNKFTNASYIEAVEQSLRYLGYDFKRREKTTLFIDNPHPYKVEFIPPQDIYCLAKDNAHLVVQLRGGRISNVRRTDATTITVNYTSYATDYYKFQRSHILHLPLITTDSQQGKWSVYRDHDGISTFIAPIPTGQQDAEYILPCSDSLKLEIDESAKFIDEVVGTSGSQPASSFDDLKKLIAEAMAAAKEIFSS